MNRIATSSRLNLARNKATGGSTSARRIGGSGVMNWMLSGIGQRIARYLQRRGGAATSPSRRAIRMRCAPRSSPATCCWSKATTTSPASSSISPSPPGRMPRSMSARSASAPAADGEPLVLVEANLGEGVVGAPLSKYHRYHTRICRPIGLTARRLRARLHLCRRAHRLRLRRQEHLRSAALSVPAAGAAALAPAHDGARLRPSRPASSARR